MTGGDLLLERWKTVNKHPMYEVSDLGKIRNKKTGKMLNPYDDGSGYLRVKLNGKNCRLHILVAVAFIPNLDNLPIVNHKDTKKHNCKAVNLEWVTPSENVQHSWDFRKEKERKQLLVVIRGKEMPHWPGKKISRTV